MTQVLTLEQKQHKKEWSREYKRKHRDRIVAYRREWRLRHGIKPHKHLSEIIVKGDFKPEVKADSSEEPIKEPRIKPLVRRVRGRPKCSAEEETAKWRALLFDESNELDDVKPPFDYRKSRVVQPLNHWLNGNQERIV